MDRSAAAISVLTLAGLIAATLWVPAVPEIGRYTWAERESLNAAIARARVRRREVGLPDLPPDPGVPEPSYWAWGVTAWPDLHFRPVWSLDVSVSPESVMERLDRDADLSRRGLPVPRENPRENSASIHGPTLLVELAGVFAIGVSLVLLRRRRRAVVGQCRSAP